jgi:hypothetical protein
MKVGRNSRHILFPYTRLRLKSDPFSISAPPVTPTPAPFGPDECGRYDACDSCPDTRHCAPAEGVTCNATQFYFQGNAACQATVPPPAPTAWPKYDVNARFCYLLSSTNCRHCVSANPAFRCEWCLMGDDIGL